MDNIKIISTEAKIVKFQCPGCNKIWSLNLWNSEMIEGKEVSCMCGASYKVIP